MLQETLILFPILSIFGLWIMHLLLAWKFQSTAELAAITSDKRLLLMAKTWRFLELLMPTCMALVALITLFNLDHYIP